MGKGGSIVGISRGSLLYAFMCRFLHVWILTEHKAESLHGFISCVIALFSGGEILDRCITV